MKQKLSLFRVPHLTGLRMALALGVALIIDGLQFCLGPFGWVFVDQGLDVVGMVLTNWILGFHVLLLPTFVVKLVPLLDELPTWTACVVAVITLRKRQQHAEVWTTNATMPAETGTVPLPPLLRDGGPKDPPLPR
jgi:hypothetical protein